MRLFQQRETEGESHAISVRAGKPALTSSTLPNWLFVFNELTYCYSRCRLESIKTLMYFVKLKLCEFSVYLVLQMVFSSELLKAVKVVRSTAKTTPHLHH